MQSQPTNPLLCYGDVIIYKIKNNVELIQPRDCPGEHEATIIWFLVVRRRSYDMRTQTG